MTLTKNFGMIALSIYLILDGLISLTGTLIIPSVVFGILALVAGVLILIGK